MKDEIEEALEEEMKKFQKLQELRKLRDKSESKK